MAQRFEASGRERTPPPATASERKNVDREEVGGTRGTPSEREESLSALLSDKVRSQAREIQHLLLKINQLEDSHPSCAQVDKSPLVGRPPVGDQLLVRDGPPSFNQHNQLVKQLATLSKEYRLLNKKLEDAHRERKQLRSELTTKQREAATFQRQLFAAQKVLADAKTSHKEELALKLSSPVAGRQSNASADRQAIAQLVKTVKSLQDKVETLEGDKAVLEEQLQSLRSMADDEAAYNAELKHALDVQTGSSSPELSGRTHSTVVEELVKTRATVVALRQHNADLQKQLDAQDMSPSKVSPSKGTPHRKKALDTIQRHAEESVLLRQEIARLEGEKAALLEHIERGDEERETLTTLLQSAEDSADRARAEAVQAAGACRSKEAEAEASRMRSMELSENVKELVKSEEALRADLVGSHGAQEELLAALREAKLGLSSKEHEVQKHQAAALQVHQEMRELRERCESEVSELQRRVDCLSNEVLAAQGEAEALRAAALHSDRAVEGDRQSARNELIEARKWMDEARKQLDRQSEQVICCHEIRRTIKRAVVVFWPLSACELSDTNFAGCSRK